MSSLVITIKSPKAASAVEKVNDDNKSLRQISNLINGIAQGSIIGSVDLQSSANDPVAASGTATAANISVDDTITIAKVVLTAKASPSTENQFSQAGTDSQNAASLAAVINAHSVLSKIVRASASAAVVTITLLTKGAIGNQVGLTSSNGTRLAVSGSGYLTGGAGGIESQAKAYR